MSVYKLDNYTSVDYELENNIFTVLVKKPNYCSLHQKKDTGSWIVLDNFLLVITRKGEYNDDYFRIAINLSCPMYDSEDFDNTLKIIVKGLSSFDWFKYEKCKLNKKTRKIFIQHFLEAVEETMNTSEFIFD